MSVYHGEQIGADGIHVPYSYIYNDDAALSAATGFLATDVGKFARKKDDESVWMLIGISPVRWQRVSHDPSAIGNPAPTLVAGDGIGIDLDVPANTATINNTAQSVSSFVVAGQPTFNVPGSGIVNLEGQHIDIELDNVNSIIKFILGAHASTHEAGGSDPVSVSGGTGLDSADREKLDSIEHGAQVNQNAFSAVASSGQGTLTADSPTDTLNFEIVNGTISTNPSTNTITISVPTTGGSTLSPHAATHLIGGSDEIHFPNATQQTKGFMTTVQVAKLDSIEFGATAGVASHASTHLTGGSDAIALAKSSKDTGGKSDGLMSGDDKDYVLGIADDLLAHKQITEDDHLNYIHVSEPRTVSARHTFTGGMQLISNATTTNMPILLAVTDGATPTAALGIYQRSSAVSPSGSVRFGVYVEHHGNGAAYLALPKGISQDGFHARVGGEGCNGYLANLDNANNTGSMYRGVHEGLGNGVYVSMMNALGTGNGVRVQGKNAGAGIFASQLGTGGVVEIESAKDSSFGIKTTVMANNTSSTSYALHAIQNSLAICSKFEITNASNTNACVKISTLGSGDAMSVYALNGNNAIRVTDGNIKVEQGGIAVANDSTYWGGVEIMGDITNRNGPVKIADDLTITGTLSKASGTFRIDHPLDPKNKILSHSFVESPDMKNIYDGVIILGENGYGTVELPHYFGALNEGFCYQLTAIGGYAGNLKIHEEIKNNRFVIAGEPFSKVSWQVTGKRIDAYALAHPVVVEEEKTIKEYIHPELFSESFKGV